MYLMDQDLKTINSVGCILLLTFLNTHTHTPSGFKKEKVLLGFSQDLKLKLCKSISAIQNLIRQEPVIFPIILIYSCANTKRLQKQCEKPSKQEIDNNEKSNLTLYKII